MHSIDRSVVPLLPLAGSGLDQVSDVLIRSPFRNRASGTSFRPLDPERSSPKEFGWFMRRTGRYLFTSESVTEGHPDKIADQVSDAVLDAVLSSDPDGSCRV